MLSQPISFFERTRHPYYIVSPAFRQSSGGIRAMHYLCHVLNEAGQEAYISTEPGGINPYLRTPELTRDIIRQHRESGCVPIGVYPEVVKENMLDLPIVARWILNKPGHLGGEMSYGKDEILFYWDDWMIDSSITADKLNIPIIDRRIFNHRDAPSERKGFCYYANKYFKFSRELSPALVQNGTSLCLKIPRSPQEIAGILRNSEAFYCYEPSSLVLEALACGCPVAMIDTPYLDEFEWEKNPIFRIKESEIGKTKLPEVDLDRAAEYFQRIETQAQLQIENFIEKTQAAANSLKSQSTASVLDDLEKTNEVINKSSTNKSSAERAYKNWLKTRTEIFSKSTIDLKNIKIDTIKRFHLIIKLHPTEISALANTLDSLAAQTHHEWQLDVFSRYPSPDGLDEIDCITWRTLSESDLEEILIKQCIIEMNCDWIIEIPAGAILDPVYLSKINNSASKHHETKAFFVDDDYHDEIGVRKSPRFKPGCNPAALLSSDLAGVLCVQRDAWLALAEDAIPADNNFALLLGLSEKFGWNCIEHIPDVLLSYPENFLSNNADCKAQLRDHLQTQGIDAEILQSGPKSWCIRRPLPDEPRVTIVILAEGVFELLSRCLESLCSLTQYKNYETLVNLKSDDAVPDVLNLLHELQEKYSVPIQADIASSDATYANRCNTAVDRINSEFIVFLKEEAQIIQETWLGELVRTATEEHVAAVMPRLITPGSAKIENIGHVLGLGRVRGLPYYDGATISDAGYLDYIQMPRDISLLPHACYLIRKQSYLQAGGMDAKNFPDYWADADLSMRLRQNEKRLICQPLSNLVFQITDQYQLPKTADEIADSVLNKNRQEDTFIQRWWPNAAVDPFWNPNLSLVESIPTPETQYFADWKAQPLDLPRILARPVNNGQGYFRITAALNALQRTGMAQQCIWEQGKGKRAFIPAEILRLAPDSVIVQNYMSDGRLQSLAELYKAPDRPFLVFTVDDLMDGLAQSNPLIATIPPNPKARLKHAFAHCDRLVVSTAFLAETYQHLIRDIKVVPNRLEQAVWIPLRSAKRTTKKPRIGWAGGTTHQDDLLLLQEVIEKTRDEADWVFMGMCPEEIRPLIHEFHSFVNMDDYPAYLAALNLDIAVAPLAEIPFNRAKSNLRLLEYGMLGIPVVCTDIDPYRNSPACCVPNKAQAWIAALRDRIHNPEAREAEGARMRRWVLDNYLLENHLTEWLEAHLP